MKQLVEMIVWFQKDLNQIRWLFNESFKNLWLLEVYRNWKQYLRQNISGKVNKYNKIGQDYQNLISNFACFLFVIVKVYFLESRLDAR